MSSLPDFILQRADLPREEIEWLLGQAKPRTLPRGGVFCAMGQADHEIGFLEEGILQVFALSPEGRKILLDFVFAGSVALALDSATRGIPSEVVFEAVTPCIVTVMPYHLRHVAVERHPGWERLATRMTEEVFARKQQRHMSLRSKSARQRYAELALELPAEWRQIPQHLIAAYLNITPQYLSNLRRGHGKGRGPIRKA
ncbi:Crp/Fnr family transcriptional regulator [Starkeya sp. 3C]|uniref:Crp/Fnr family transcriptional regulator n=1 Tax=Ancylobacter moscoviensis TaxID=2597768 RepID=A0ABY3DWI8_9HYPH|nr:Crp/Fnr family transcriptional regulator [Ancylobacter moscoviensis]TSJ64476.1 Crp/Fnr family transcriptional regulator [Ancylobacter moscoviensis]